jgi:hypothetical protein
MLNNTYDGRRPLFWIVTLMAATVVVHIVLAFWRSRFAHPVSAVADLMVASAIWLFYFSIVRAIRVSRSEIADTLAKNIETSAAMCCLLGYILSLPN